MLRKLLFLTATLLLFAPDLFAEGTQNIDYTTLDIEELVNIPVTSVSKKEERGFEAPAAIFVLTNDDIRKSGATSIPEVLRLVPGLHVAKIGSHTWSISARGFPGRFANKLLVLMDGRSVYTPLFSGVYWDVQDTLLEDVDRIEVIRGPGATLWGANAVNGVINIVTKSAHETQGGLVQGIGGSEDLGIGSIRYGEKISEDTAYRIYGKYFERDELKLEGGGDADDAWSGGQVGFRVDSKLSDKDEITLQGDLYTRDEEQILTGFLDLSGPIPTTNRRSEDVDAGGGNLLFRWNRELEDDSALSFQTYWSRNRRDDFDGIDQTIDEIDFDLQHRLSPIAGNQLTWGVGYRIITDDIQNTPSAIFDDPDQTFGLVTGFLQDKVALTDDVELTLGTKLEHNDFSGFEVQPGVRVGWSITERDFFWSSITRAVRTPTRLEQDGTFFPSTGTLPNGAPFLPEAVGNGQLEAENLVAYELGYRKHLDRSLIDFSAFYNHYDDLANFVPNPSPVFLPQFGPLPIIQSNVMNASAAESYGGEITIEHAPMTWLRLQASYWYFKLHFTSFDPLEVQETPEHQALLRMIFSLHEDVDLSATGRYVDSVSSINIEPYITADVRLAWRVQQGLELMVVGQNLVEDTHMEFADVDSSFTARTQNERAVYGGFTWTFQ